MRDFRNNNFQPIEQKKNEILVTILFKLTLK